MENQTNTTEQQDNTYPKRDLYQEVTDTIIAQLEAGVVPWQKPWIGEGSPILSLPENTCTGNHYRGINILLLWSAAIKHEFPIQEWASFQQWKNQKQTIKKGEKGTTIVYYDTIDKEEDGEVKKIPFLKSSVVFNKSQLTSFEYEAQTVRVPTPIYVRNEKVDHRIQNTKAVIKTQGSEACYVPSKDIIRMPPLETFCDLDGVSGSDSYYATLLHELTHWTGHPDRLDRKGGKKFGDQAYAKEELVAELGAAFLCAELEICNQPNPNHASYIDHWLKALKENKYCLIQAASQAKRAASYITAVSGGLSTDTP